MSNLVVIIANAYKEFDKNYNNESHLTKKYGLFNKLKKHKENTIFYLVSILDFIISVVIMLININYVFGVIGINVAYVIFMIVFIRYLNSSKAKKCNQRYKEYKTKICLFNDILRKTYSIDSRSKLLFLIEQCTSTKKVLEYKINLAPLLPALGTLFAIPKSLENLNIMIISILIVLFILILYIGFIIQSTSNRLLNNYSNGVKTLEYVLTDIYYCIYLSKEYKIE